MSRQDVLSPLLKQTAVILVNYNNAPDTLECLACLQSLNGQPAHIIVVDNKSTDNSLDLIQNGWGELFTNAHGVTSKISTEIVPALIQEESVQIPQCAILPLPINGGFAAGNNAALQILLANTDSEYFWLLNNDTCPRPEALNALLTLSSSNTTYGVVGSTLIYSEKPTVVQALGGASFNPLLGTTKHIGAGVPLASALQLNQKNIESQLSDITGASMLVKREVFESVGFMKESFFLYCEETEWCLRIKKVGYILGWAPQSIVVHKEGSTTGAGKTTRSSFMDYLMLRNRIRVIRMHYPWFLPIAVLSYFVVWLRRVQRRQKNAGSTVFRALRDGLGG